MGFLLFLGLVVLFIFSWVFWVIAAVLFFAAAAIVPWGIWELFMYLTFNNIINAAAKLPGCLGSLVGFVLTLPFAAVALAISLWTYVQTFLMALLTFLGGPLEGGSSGRFISDYVSAFESEECHHMIIVRFYYEHCQWLWGGAGFMHSYYPWQNGCGKGWVEGSDFWWPVGEIPIPVVIIKLLFLALPYMILFVAPLFPIIWSLTRPFLGATAHLPAVSNNGDGRD